MWWHKVWGITVWFLEGDKKLSDEWLSPRLLSEYLMRFFRTSRRLQYAFILFRTVVVCIVVPFVVSFTIYKCFQISWVKTFYLTLKFEGWLTILVSQFYLLSGWRKVRVGLTLKVIQWSNYIVYIGMGGCLMKNIRAFMLFIASITWRGFVDWLLCT